MFKILLVIGIMMFMSTTLATALWHTHGTTGHVHGTYEDGHEHNMATGRHTHGTIEHEHGTYETTHKHNSAWDRNLNLHDHDSNGVTITHKHGPADENHNHLHWHTVEHSHDNYASHVHSGSHSDLGVDIHPHPHTDPHSFDSDHSGVSERQPELQQRSEVPPGGPAEHTHSGHAHQHGDFVVHTHPSVTHIHTYTDPDHPYDYSHAEISTRTTPNVNQPPVNQPTVNQPVNTPPANNQPVNTSPVVSGNPQTTQTTGTTTESSGATTLQPTEPTHQAAASTPPVVNNAASVIHSAARPKSIADPTRVRLTEIMLVDLNGSLPHWFELYNFNQDEIDLTGWKLYYFRTEGHVNNRKLLHITINDMKIPGRSAIILTTSATEDTSLKPEKIYVMTGSEGQGINLKSGWKLVAPGEDGEEIVVSEQPKDENKKRRFGDGNVQRKLHGTIDRNQQGRRFRASFEYLPSEEVEESYYGSVNDKGTPGFYQQPAPAAPSLSRPKKIGTWAGLKRK